MERPYSSLRITELVDLSRDSWDSPYVLCEIHAELGFRRRKRPRALRELINQRLLTLAQESFKWPSTAIMERQEALTGIHVHREGVLSFMGYKVGLKGLSVSARRTILDYAFNGHLPCLNSTIYMREWGEPGSGRRLRKMANSLAFFRRSAEGRDYYADMTAANEDWSNDLEYLRLKYYTGRFDLTLPRIYESRPSASDPSVFDDQIFTYRHETGEMKPLADDLSAFQMEGISQGEQPSPLLPHHMPADVAAVGRLKPQKRQRAQDRHAAQQQVSAMQRGDQQPGVRTIHAT